MDSEAALTEDEVEIPTAGLLMPAYCARPGSRAQSPVIIVVQEIFGLHEHMREVCRRLATAGYLAVAPSLYFRQGDVTAMPDVRQIITKVVSKVPDDQVIQDLDATVRWAKNEGDISRLAMTGFCWGGRIVWLYAAHSARLKAAAAWYGKLVSDRPKNPLDVAADLKAPVIGFYGGKDASIPLDTVEKMRAAIKPPSEIVVYEDADHAFNADYRETYNESAATDAWRRMIEFFKQHGAF